MHAALAHTVIPLGFEPKTHALEGRCSNPTELRNLLQMQCKVTEFFLRCKAQLLIMACKMLRGAVNQKFPFAVSRA